MAEPVLAKYSWRRCADGDGPHAPGRRPYHPAVTKIELFVSDLDRSRAFYEALGFRVVREFGDWQMLALGDNVLDLQGDTHAVAGPHYFTPEIGRFPRGTGVEISIEVEDVDALYALAQRLAVDIVKPIQDRSWKARDFRIADPDGYFIRFTTPLHRERLTEG
jgi:catechol 2,3-dioxygenase-like lactoylglutathione lyase family enzyme